MTGRCDFKWTRQNLAAMLGVCAAAWICLGAMAAVRPVSLSGTIPTDEARAASARESIDPNTASVASLRRLPGIGPARAAAIVEYRSSAAGPFTCAEDLTKVSGIGPATAAEVRPYLSFPEAGNLR